MCWRDERGTWTTECEHELNENSEVPGTRSIGGPIKRRSRASVNFGFSNGRGKQTDFDGCEGDRGLVELVAAQGRGQEVDDFGLSQLRFTDAGFKFKSDW
ncbi:hypothetical protein RUM43_005518 [Polyplax serrata]|uniref:Uncharacterized protein n=1 Tax=Polyplax serrata TaxID=468196 RepID=A0AAN8S4U0_POLSC